MATSGGPGSGRQLLQRTPMAVLLGGAQKVLVLQRTQSVGEGLELLKNRGCVSAPVRDMSAGRYIGVFTLVDVCKHLLETLARCDAHQQKRYNEFLAGAADAFFNMSVGDLLQQYHRQPFPYIPLSSTSMSVELLLQRVLTKGIHRLVVADADDSISHIISQSNALAWIEAHLDQFGPVMARTAQELGFVKQVVCLPAESNVLTALATLLDHKVHGIALVDGRTGAMTGEFSEGSLRGLTRDSFVALQRPVSECVAGLRTAVGLAPMELHAVPTSATLRDIVVLMRAAHLHRLFLVGEGGRPVGIVTLTDVLQTILSC